MSNKKRRLQKVNRQQLLIILSVIFLVAAAYYYFNPGTQQVELYFERPDGSKTSAFQAAVASTEQERSRGLMFVKELPTHQGMLFVFPSETKQGFWMKNTYIPLDIIFIDSQRKVVGIVDSARPLTTKQREIDRPSRYVLELNGGVAKQQNITVGSKLVLKDELLSAS